MKQPDKLTNFLQQHSAMFKWILLGYVVFNACFIFPLWSTRFPLDFSKAYLVIVGYGLIGWGLFRVFATKKEWFIFIITFFLTASGLVCRYFLEFGEYSNTYNFTVKNILIYMAVIPLYVTLCYYFFKRSKHVQIKEKQ